MDFGKFIAGLLTGTLGACSNTVDAHRATTLDLLIRPRSFERHIAYLEEKRNRLLEEIAYLDEQIALAKDRLRNARWALRQAERRELISSNRRSAALQQLEQLHHRSGALSKEINRTRDILNNDRQPAVDSYQALKQDVAQLDQDTHMFDSVVHQLTGLYGEQTARQRYRPY